MKRLTEITLTLAIALSASLPVMAAELMNTIPAGQQVNGQVESVDGSTVMIKTASGDTQSYRVDPSLISALKLGSGSNIVIDGSRLLMGQVLHLDSYTAEVALDNNGGEKSYILTRESRRYLAAGDRVVITPDLRLVRADLYTLTAADLRLQSVMMASSVMEHSVSSETHVRRQVSIGGGEITAPAVVTPEPSVPVGGLW